MTYENLVSQLKLTRDKAKTKPVYTGELNVANMLDDVIWFIREQEKQAELGRAVRLAIKEKHGFATYEAFDCFGFVDEAYALPTEKDIKDLLEWAKRVE